MIMVRHNTIYKNKYFFCCYRVFEKSFSFFLLLLLFCSVVVANSLTAHAADIARSDAHSAYQLRGDHQPSPSTRWFRVESSRAVPCRIRSQSRVPNCCFVRRRRRRQGTLLSQMRSLPLALAVAVNAGIVNSIVSVIVGVVVGVGVVVSRHSKSTTRCRRCTARWNDEAGCIVVWRRRALRESNACVAQATFGNPDPSVVWSEVSIN